MPEDLKLRADYILCLVWTDNHRKAADEYLAHEKELQKIPYLSRHVAKAFYELRDFSRARELYRTAWSRDRKDEEAFKGFVYSSLRLGDLQGAYTAWDQARREKWISAGTLQTAEAHILEAVGAARGALSVARELERTDDALVESMRIDAAVMKMRWGEIDAAIADFEDILSKNPGNDRARWDYIVALRKKDRMEEVLQQYGILKESGKEVPYWVTEAVADACLYLRKPEEAESLYRMTLEKNPDNPYSALMGLFYTYVDLRKWDKGEETLRQVEALLEREKRTLEGDPNILARKRYLAEYNEFIAARGWFLLYQDRLAEGQGHFERYLREAGFDTGLRAGLGHAYLWRHWPRRALEQFEVAENIDPNDKTVLTGKAWALNDLNRKEESRALAGQLSLRYPTDLHVRDLQETLKAEDMRRFVPEVWFSKEFDGATEYWLYGTLEIPYSPTFRPYVQILRQETSQDINGQTLRADWDRLALGFNWIVTPEIVWQQAFGFDYLEGGDVGSYTKLTWWPTDPLKISGVFDSFSLAIPLRARVYGITGKTAALDFNYLESDLREYGLAIGSNWLSDDNINPFGRIRYSQNVYNDPDVKVRMGFQFDYSHYTDQDVPYFSPEHDFTLLLTPTVFWTHYHRYDQRWRSGFYPRAGVNYETDYDFYPVAGITYEQLLVLSKTFQLTWNVSYDLRVYDGDYTNVLGAYFTFQWCF
jgi:biofilm PGA synthesis protein PgaA